MVGVGGEMEARLKPSPATRRDIGVCSLLQLRSHKEYSHVTITNPPLVDFPIVLTKQFDEQLDSCVSYCQWNRTRTHPRSS
jgi:hypothetical protein